MHQVWFLIFYYIYPPSCHTLDRNTYKKSSLTSVDCIRSSPYQPVLCMTCDFFSFWDLTCEPKGFSFLIHFSVGNPVQCLNTGHSTAQFCHCYGSGGKPSSKSNLEEHAFQGQTAWTFCRYYFSEVWNLGKLFNVSAPQCTHI